MDDWRDLSNPQVQSAVAWSQTAIRNVDAALRRGDLVPLTVPVQQHLDVPQGHIAPAAPYQVYLDPIALGQLEATQSTQRRTILVTLKALEIEPCPSHADCALLVPAIELWRLRIDSYPLLYRVHDSTVIVVGITEASFQMPQEALQQVIASET